MGGNNYSDTPFFQPKALTKLSELENDIGFIEEEIDPTVPSWAKGEDKPEYTAAEVGAINLDEKGSANGVAELNDSGKVPSTQLPSYVDDVIEVADFASLPVEGENGKIYVILDANKTYRWTGTVYVEISESLALGETSSTAYRGDQGKTAYDHVSITGNPHGTEAIDIEVEDIGEYFEATTVEESLQEIGEQLDGLAEALEGLL